MSSASILDTLKGALIKSAFILGSAFLVFESARNSITWYLIRFWGGAGDVWQQLWDRVLAVTGTDPFFLDVYCTYTLTAVFFWTVILHFSQNRFIMVDLF